VGKAKKEIPKRKVNPMTRAKGLIMEKELTQATEKNSLHKTKSPTRGLGIGKSQTRGKTTEIKKDF